MGVSTGGGDRDTLGAASGRDSRDLWVGLVSPISHIGPIGWRSPDASPDAAMPVDRYPCPSQLLDSSS
jgi:hypothetical protein